MRSSAALAYGAAQTNGAFHITQVFAAWDRLLRMRLVYTRHAATVLFAAHCASNDARRARGA